MIGAFEGDDSQFFAIRPQGDQALGFPGQRQAQAISAFDAVRSNAEHPRIAPRRLGL
jgi:hypothetical protein